MCIRDRVINDPTASAFHATVTPLGQGHLLRDLRSASGTFVNGQRVTQHTLRPDDDILIGSVQLRYDGHHLALVDLRRAGIRLDGVSLRKQVPAAKASAGDSGFQLLPSAVSLVIPPPALIALVAGTGTGSGGRGAYRCPLGGQRVARPSPPRVSPRPRPGVYLRTQC